MNTPDKIRRIHPLLALTVLCFLALSAAYVLFGALSSSGIVKNQYVEFGGAAAGFFVALILLQRWYRAMESKHVSITQLQHENEELRKRAHLPQFTVPESFAAFIDHEHSLLFCYPKQWKKVPLIMAVQGVFKEDASRLRSGDAFPGQFNVVVSSSGQQTYLLREVCQIAAAQNISAEALEKQLDVRLTPANQELEIPLERLLDILGVAGTTKQQKIYELNYLAIEAITGAELRRDIEVVGGIESLRVEWEIDRGDLEPLVQIQVCTYLEKTDLTVVFTFQDNLEDRDSMQTTCKQVLASARFW